MGRNTYSETPTRRRRAKVVARIQARVFPAPTQRSASVKREKERRKRKEKDAKPTNQLPGCRDDNPAPSTNANGRIQRKSVFLKFMWRDSTLLAMDSYRFVVCGYNSAYRQLYRTVLYKP